MNKKQAQHAAAQRIVADSLSALDCIFHQGEDRAVQEGMPNTTTVGPLMVNFDAKLLYPVELQHKLCLRASESLELLQWLYERKDALIQLARDEDED